MTLRVLFHDQLLFEAGASEGLVVPFSEVERALAVEALSSALAALSGIAMRSQADAVVVEFGPRCSLTAPEIGGRVVVPFRNLPLHGRAD